MKKRGSWGLKQARYEISWRLCAARCLEVQNSLVNVLTCTEAPASLVTTSRSVAVAVPSQRKLRTDSSNAEGSSSLNGRIAAAVRFVIACWWLVSTDAVARNLVVRPRIRSRDNGAAAI